MTPSTTRSKTILCDIDGTIFGHTGSMTGIVDTKPGEAKLLPGVREKFDEWDGKGYNIVLTTGRKESAREVTEAQLRAAGLFWGPPVDGLGWRSQSLDQ
jgi:ribonucleotide monophosphatase NagD (HAD superfamily)